MDPTKKKFILEWVSWGESLPLLDVMQWERPQEGWGKCNFDGASKGNPGSSGTGYIIRDSKGDLVACGGKHLIGGTSNVAEAKVALLAIRASKTF